MRKAYKSIISLAVVLIAGLNFIVPAFAQDPFTDIAIGGIGGASSAGLFGSMAGMSGIDIAWSQSGSDPMDAMWNVLNPDHVYFSGEKHEADPLTDPEDIWDYITVDIGDWLSAQSDFIIAFAQANQVKDNDSGTTVIPLEFEGVPITTAIGSNYISAPLDSTILVSGQSDVLESGNYRAVLTNNGSNSFVLQWYYNGNLIQTVPSSSYNLNRTYDLILVRESNNAVKMALKYRTDSYINIRSPQIGNGKASGSVNWSSGNVDTSVFDGWEKAKVKIPHSVSGLPSGWTVPDFTDALNDLWNNGLQGHIVIEDTDQPVPPQPVPDTPLGNVPFDDWVDLWGQGIYQQLENQSDTLDLIGSNGEDQIEELESIDSKLDDLNQTAESIDTNIGAGNGILGGIRSLAQSAVDFLEGIAEHVGELVEEIVEGTETLIAGILNQIPHTFSVIFGPIKQASSIWHYVVEWIQSIGAPFQFIWSMASGTSYYIILPVYASLAASVVLAFYKRFGK